MYLQFYNLRKAPFQPGTAPEFFWKGEKYSAVLRGLQRAVEKGGGVSLLTGEVGTGKTAVLHRLLGMLGKDVMACLIPDPHLSVPDFYRLILHAFRIRRNIDNRMAFAQCLDDLSQKAGRRGKKILLVIDEAQCLSPQLTAEIAAMQKLPLNTAGRLHVCLVAQTGSGRRSIAPLIEALAPHITADLHLDPLNPDETAAYVRHRLKTAGAGEDLFSDEALKAVFQYSGGYPIQVNLVCDFALFSGFAERAPQIGEDIVNWSAQGLHLPDSADEQSEDELLEALYRPAAPAGSAGRKTSVPVEDNATRRPDGPAAGAVRGSRPADAPAGGGEPPAAGKRRFSFKTAVATAAVLALMGAGYAAYTVHTRPVSRRSGPAAQASAAAGTTAGKFSVHPGRSSGSDPVAPAAAANKMPVRPAAESPRAPAPTARAWGEPPSVDTPAAPTPAPETRTPPLPSGASPDRPGPSAVFPPPAPAPAHREKAAAEEPSPASVPTDADTAAAGQRAAPEDSSAAKKPAPPPAGPLSPNPSGTVSRQTPPPPATHTPSGNSALPSAKASRAPQPANRSLKAILQAAPFAPRKTTQARDAHAAAAAPVRPAAAGEPDPSKVIDWLLKKKGE